MKEIQAIAIFRSPFTSKFGIPRQSGIATTLRGRIVFEQDYGCEEALRGLADFDYLWLIWGFSANKESAFRPTVRPPRLGGNERMGVWATRSPFRPNGLGLSSVRIAKIGKGWIDVLGADLMDGTPIYDIKPYVAYADSHPDARGGFTDRSEWKKLKVDIPEALLRELSHDEAEALTAVLEQDPRPHYQHDARRIYGMPFAGRDIKFRVEGETVNVVSFEELKD